MFWKSFKRFSKKISNIYPEIVYNDKLCNTPESVSNAFASSYENVYSEYSGELSDNNFKSEIETKYFDILKTSCGKFEVLPGGIIREEEVCEVISNLKLKKSPGHDRIQNEHLKFGENEMVQFFCTLLNRIVLDGWIPKRWKLGLIVPIYKVVLKFKISKNTLAFPLPN